MNNLIIMISLFFIGVSHCSLKINFKIAPKRSDDLTYQLPQNVFPQHYMLKITPEFNNKTFTGYVKIVIRVTTPIINITLHQQNLNIAKEKLYLTAKNGINIRIKNAGVSGTKEQQFYTITLQKQIQANTYNLFIPEFYGILNNNNEGFYYAQYIDTNKEVRKFAMTQFEATYARYAFPCFDEPAFRSTFQIYIIRPPNYHSIANTKLIKSKKLNNGLYQDEFETTILMPTYLVAFIVSEMRLLSDSDQNFHRILARPGPIDKGHEKYGLKMAKIILPTLETYFKVNYSLNKMDQAAIPSGYYDSTAMENWGLVTYVEHTLLFTPRTTANMNIMIDATITHEFAHQWFGNIVTMKWWRYLWLKEGFATFLESRIMDMIKPEWKMMEQFIVKTKQDCLETDSSNQTRDMNQDVGTPKEISKAFDSISYDKAACVIHMLETIMTPDVFQRGITNYLQNKSLQSAIPIDLYENFQKAVTNSGMTFPKDLNINKIMSTWDSQKGYPLIYVERNYDINKDVVKLTQSRYIYEKKFRSTSTPWFIPINYATKSNPNFNDTQFNDWLLKSNEKITIENLTHTDWLILNKQEAYYYRVNYDRRNWKLITEALLENYTNIHILNRAQLIDDSFNFAKADMLDFEVLLKISTYLYEEDNYITDYSFSRAARYIMIQILLGADIEETFQAHVIRIFKPAYERLGDNPRSNDTLIDKLHRILVLEWMGRLNYFQSRKKARKMFNLWRYNNALLPVDLEKQILCNTIRIGKQTDWEYLFKIYQSLKNNDNFKKNVFYSLGCTKDLSSLQRLLDVSLQIGTQSNYNFAKVVSMLSNEGLPGLEVVMNYLGVHFNPLLATLSKYITNIFTTIASKLTTEAQLKEFAQLLKKDTTVNTQYRLILKEARLRVSANQKRAYQISKFFYEFNNNDFILITLTSLKNIVMLPNFIPQINSVEGHAFFGEHETVLV